MKLKIIALVKVLFFCQLLQTSLAKESKTRFVLKQLSHLHKKCTQNTNTDDLYMYLIEEIFVKRYTDIELKEAVKVKEVVLKNILPGYLKNESNSNINESQVKNKLNEQKLSSKGNFKSYFNGYLIKVNETWKIRKVQNDKISYSNVESSNVNELMEMFYVIGYEYSSWHSDCFIVKALTRLQLKYQLIDDLPKKQNRKSIWLKYDLDSDVVQLLIDNVNIFAFADQVKDKEEIYFGIYGETDLITKYGKKYFSEKGNEHLTFITWFEEFLDLAFLPFLHFQLEDYQERLNRHIEIGDLNEIKPQEKFENKIPDAVIIAIGGYFYKLGFQINV